MSLNAAREAAAVFEHIHSIILEEGEELAATVHSVSLYQTGYKTFDVGLGTGNTPALLFAPGTVETTADLDKQVKERKNPFPKDVTPNYGMIGIGTILADRIKGIRAGDKVYIKRNPAIYNETYDTDMMNFTVLIDVGNGQFLPSQNIQERPRVGDVVMPANAMEQIRLNEEPF